VLLASEAWDVKLDKRAVKAAATYCAAGKKTTESAKRVSTRVMGFVVR
jgi:hypothetical protein